MYIYIYKDSNNNDDGNNDDNGSNDTTGTSYNKVTSALSSIAIIDLQPEHLKRPALIALNFLLQTGQLTTVGKIELEVTDSVEKNATASS